MNSDSTIEVATAHREANGLGCIRIWSREDKRTGNRSLLSTRYTNNYGQAAHAAQDFTDSERKWRDLRSG